MFDALRDAGPPLGALLFVVFGLLSWANRKAIKDFWLDVIFGDA